MFVHFSPLATRNSPLVMCGIAGLIDRERRGESQEPGLRARLAVMQARLRHRGPDDEGLFVDEAAGVGLAHTRLAILDLSPAGHQPMSVGGGEWRAASGERREEAAGSSGRYTIVFNGEIYNFRELRAELQRAGETFRSQSDTEVILHLYRRLGTRCVERLEGMFAFAIWDREERTCFLARDPLGIKPLYVWRHDGTLAFASEMRALLEADLGPRRLCPEALREYLLFGSVQEPNTLVEGVTMLPAGHTLLWREGEVRIDCYWELEFPAPDLAQQRPAEAAQVASEALDQSVNRHFVSDVPVGIFLSGGLDSTALVALARRRDASDLRTFSISFDEAEFNEGNLAARTATHFQTRHHDWRLSASEGKSLVEDFLAALDQPSNDGFNSYCVSKFARDLGAKVVLSGLGGDELFGSYPSFQRIPMLLDWHRRLQMAKPLGDWLGRGAQRFQGRNKLQRLGTFLRSEGSVQDAYWAMRGIFSPAEADKLVAEYCAEKCAEKGSGTFCAKHPPGRSGKRCPTPFPHTATIGDQISYLETTRYMRNQLLRDSDVMSMAWGLELRVPLVDRVLIETLGRIPSSLRLAAGKRLLLDAVPEIPDWITNQPKRGFRFPLQQWISQDWRDVFAELDRNCPVSLVTWYRRWTLFTLNHFLEANSIETREASGERWLAARS